MNTAIPSHFPEKKIKLSRFLQLLRRVGLCQNVIYRAIRNTIWKIPLARSSAASFGKGGESSMLLSSFPGKFSRSDKSSSEITALLLGFPPLEKGARGIYKSFQDNIKSHLVYWLTLILAVGVTSCSYDRERQGASQSQKKETAPAQKAAVEETPKSTYAASVYLENSGSMDGYVRGNTQFEDAIYRMLVDVGYWADTLQLYYINSQPIPYQQDISQFISDLEPQEFQRRGGNRGNSNLNEILQKVAAQASQGEVSALVSDFIFSVKGGNTEDLLNNQKISLYNTFRQQLGQSPFSTLVIKLQSEFSGSYYDKNDRPISLSNTIRPYYIWMMGPEEAIRSLQQKVRFSALDGYQTSYFLSADQEGGAPFYTVLSNTMTTASFRTDRDYSSADYVRGIEKVEMGRRGDSKKLSFAVAIDLASIPAEENYVISLSNYRVEGYQLDSIVSISEVARTHPRDQSLIEGKASHVLVVSTEQTNYPDLKISLVKQTPAWVLNTSSTDDTGIQRSKTQQTQTFGLQYLVEGVEEAYEQVFNNQEVYFTAEVSVKK